MAHKKKAFAAASMNGQEDILRRFYGPESGNLKALAEILGVSVSQRGHEIRLSDASQETLETGRHILDALRNMAEEGLQPTAGDVEGLVSLARSRPGLDLTEYSRPRPGGWKKVLPKTEGQKLYLEAIETHDLVFGLGPAGAGKTYLAVAMAAAALASGRVSRLILTRPAVEAGERLGFLPGDLAEKINPYLRPLYDALDDLLPYEKYVKLTERRVIEVAPLAFMRGRTLSDAFVILDEAQNATREQMKMFLTRLGPGSQAVVTGDPSQSDLPGGMAQGLLEAVQLLQGIEGIALCRFTSRDVIRHRLVKRIIEAYDQAARENS